MTAVLLKQHIILALDSSSREVRIGLVLINRLVVFSPRIPIGLFPDMCLFSFVIFHLVLI